MDKKKLLDDAIDVGGDTTGALVGAGLGAVIAGPIGTVAGALAGSAASTAFNRIGKEIRERALSRGEDTRVGKVFSRAASEISEKLKDGQTLRDDGFFDASVDSRSSAEEILEGTLLAAQREHEEKKLPYMANLYANIAFDSEVSRSMADRLIKLASELTYRQLDEIRVIAVLQSVKQHFDMRLTRAFGSLSGYSQITIASDIYDLYQSGIVHCDEVAFDAAGINPSKLTVVGYGALLFNLMQLGDMEVDDETEEIAGVLTVGKIKFADYQKELDAKRAASKAKL